jgi:hypothetical protein
MILPLAVKLVLLYTEYPAGVVMKAVISQFVRYPQEDHDGAGQTYGQPSNIQDRHTHMAGQVSEGNEKIIPDHDAFGLQL